MVAVERSSSGRIRAFDLARGLAVLFMVLVHVLQTYARPDVKESLFGQVVLFLGRVPAAPVFLFLMGVGVTLSRAQQPIRYLRRGLALLSLGYALNFFRAALPFWWALQQGWVTLDQAAPHTPLSELMLGDIFHFAGLALPLCGLLWHYRVRPSVLFIAAIAIAVLSPLLWGVQTGLSVIDAGLAFLWADSLSVSFPLFPWMTYPLLGLALGAVERERGEPRLPASEWVRLGWLLLVGGGLVMFVFPESRSRYYLRSGPGEVICMSGFVLLWLWAGHRVVERVRSALVLRVLNFWSAHVTRFYCIHWVLLGWGIAFIGEESSGYGAILTGMVLVTLAADGLTRLSLFLSRRAQGGNVS